MKKLAPFTKRNGERLVYMRAAHGIANQAARGNRSWNPGSGVSGLWPRSLHILEHTADDAAQEPQAPGKHKQPEQKSHHACQKVHLNDCVPNGSNCLITSLGP